MQTIILTVIITIIVYQTIIALVILATNENDEIVYVVASFVPMIILRLISPVIYAIRLAHCRRKYNKYGLYIVGNLCVTFLAEPNAVEKKFITDETAKYHIKKIADGKEIKSLPRPDEIYKNEEIYRGWDMEHFAKFSKSMDEYDEKAPKEESREFKVQRHWNELRKNYNRKNNISAEEGEKETTWKK